MILILYGKPGVGKGSQAKLLEKDYGFKHVSTGDIIRDVIKNQKDGYEELNKYVSNGLLVPDEIVAKLLVKELNRVKNEKIILDGFPRNKNQYNILIKLLKDRSNDIKNIYLTSDDEIIKKRILGRRICPSCGYIINIYRDGKIKNCLKCGSEMIQRKDDTLEVLEKRMEEYRKFTKPLVDFLKKNGNLIEIDGNYDDMGLIEKNIIKALGL